MANRDIITRAGKGSAIDATENDQNLKSLTGTVEEQTGTTYTVLYTDQNKTIELNNASMVCTLTAISTIHSQIDTDNFEVTLINTNATAATVNRSSTDTFTGGVTSIELAQNQSVTLQTDTTGAIWQYKSENNKSSITTVDNMTSLRGLIPISGQMVYLEGHAAINDGGGGEFIAITGASAATYTDDDGVTILPTGGDGSSAWIRDFSGKVYSSWFGATGDGSTDDTASIVAAIDYLDSIGGGELEIVGDCLCNTVSSGGGLDWIFGINQDNIHIIIPEGSKLRTTANARLFHLQGAGKPAGMASWASYEYSDATSYGIGTGNKGAISVTTSTAGDAANFAADDIIYIFTGQTISGGLGNEADAEINIVTGANAGTGEISLRWPLAKTYQQENYDSGSSGVSSVGGAGTAAPFGVANVTDRTVKNFRISGGGFIENTVEYNTIVGGQCLGFYINDLEIESGGNFQSMGNFRQSIVTRNRIHLKYASYDAYFLTTATGTTDVLYEGNSLSAARFGYLHVHEGSAQVRTINNVYTNPNGSSAFGVYDIRARCYDFKSSGDIIIGAGATNAVIVDESCTGGGEIDNLTVYAPSTIRAIRVSADSGWKIGKIHTALPSWINEGNEIIDGKRFISAAQLFDITGTSTLQTMGAASKWTCLLLDSSTTETSGFNIDFPSDWNSAYVVLHYANNGGGSGNVRWQVNIIEATEGDDIDISPTQTITETITASAQNILTTSTLSTRLTVTPSDTMSFRISRLGGDAADTLGNDIGLLGVEFKKAG